MAAGNEPVVFTIPGPAGPFHASRFRFGTLICFEDVFPELSRAFIRAGAHFLVNITNDAWYKNTPAAAQHFQASVFRAVENNAFLVRSANTGVSGFIGPTGAIISVVQDEQGRNILIPGILDGELEISGLPGTLYTRFGDWFIPACIFAVIGVILRDRRKTAA